MKRKTIALAVALIFGAGFAMTTFDAEAKSFRSSRSYSKPKPRPVIKKKTVIQRRTTVIQNNTVNSGSQGSSMMGTIAGSMAGSMAGNYLYDKLNNDANQEVPAQNQEAPKCPENFICDFENGKFYDIVNGKYIDQSK